MKFSQEAPEYSLSFSRVHLSKLEYYVHFIFLGDMTICTIMDCKRNNRPIAIGSTIRSISDDYNPWEGVKQSATKALKYVNGSTVTPRFSEEDRKYFWEKITKSFSLLIEGSK